MSEGKTALQLRNKIAQNASIKTGHAIYLGTELMKAEMAIKNNLKYEQDCD